MNQTVDMKTYVKYILCLMLLLLSIFLFLTIYNKYQDNNNKIIYEKLKNYNEEKIIENSKEIVYPVFNYKKVDNKINNLLTEYKSKDNIKINYNVYISEEYLSLFFITNDNNNISYINIDYNIKDNKFRNMLDSNLYKDLIMNKVKYKYSSDIYNSILNDNLLSSAYKITDSGLYFYFNSNIFNNIDYPIYIYLPNENDSEVFNEQSDKVVAFTFDDGPSEFTLEIMNTLLLNNSKATFFELGNRMKYNQEMVKTLISNGMEIGSHTYAHKNLNNLNEQEIDEEINSTNIIFNEITNESIKLLRPPYGNANSLVRSRVNTPIITWNIDTNDWLYRDSDYVYNHIINNIESGDIILMHDIYPETAEAVKKVVPYLVSKGYKITTVSELAKINNRILEIGNVYRSLKVE